MSPELLQFARKEGLKKWQKALKMIEAVLIDAEEKHLTDRAVKMWLDDLRDFVCVCALQMTFCSVFVIFVSMHSFQ